MVIGEDVEEEKPRSEGAGPQSSLSGFRSALGGQLRLDVWSADLGLLIYHASDFSPIKLTFFIPVPHTVMFLPQGIRMCNLVLGKGIVTAF